MTALAENPNNGHRVEQYCIEHIYKHSKIGMCSPLCEKCGVGLLKIKIINLRQ